MDFVDRQFASRPEELTRVAGGLIGGFLWRRVALVRLNGAMRGVCLGFEHPGDRVVRIGISDANSRKMLPLSSVGTSDLELVSRAKAPGKRPGISLVFLLSYTKYLEELLVRMHHECGQHKHGEACFYEETFHRLFPDGLDEGISPEKALTFCAATVASEGFFSSRAYGGPDNIDELFSAVSAAFRTLDDFGGTIADGAFEFMADLDEIAQLWLGDWQPEHLERQQKITAFALALIRMAEDLLAEEGSLLA